MATTNETLFDVQSLSIQTSSGDTLVHPLNLTLGREKVALVGESGSGKSLTARALMGLILDTLHIQVNTLKFQDQDLTHLTERDWIKLRGNTISMVLQDPKYALNPARTIGWQIEAPLLHHRRLNRAERKEKVLDMMHAVGLPNVKALCQAYPHQLSGGMGQRVMLAIALITDPVYLIADEPTSALDHAMRDQVLALIHQLVEQRNMGLLLISHDLQQVAQQCDRILVMYKGKLLDSLQAAELPQATHPYTRTLWTCQPSKAQHGQPLPTFDRHHLDNFV